MRMISQIRGGGCLPSLHGVGWQRGQSAERRGGEPRPPLRPLHRPRPASAGQNQDQGKTTGAVRLAPAPPLKTIHVEAEKSALCREWSR